MKRTQWSVAIAAVAVLALAGCAGNSADPGASDSDEAITLTYWDFIDPSQDTPRSQALKQNIENFESENPNITVQVEVVSFGDMLARLPQAAAAGTLPDVVKMYNPLVPQLADAGVYQSLGEKAAAIDDWLLPIDSLVDGAGEQIAVPYEYRSCALVYNGKILSDLGLEVPQTWDEVVTTASATAVAGFGGFGTGFSKEDNSSIIAELFDCFMTQVGQEPTNSEGEAVFATKRAEPFGDFLTDLRDADALSSSVVADQYTAVTDGLSNGTLAMGVIGTHRIITVQTLNPDVTWAPLPGVEEGDHSTTTFGWTLGIGASTEHGDAAWKFIDYLTSSEAQSLMATGGEVPVRASTYDNEFFSTPEAETVLAIRDYLENWGQPRQYPIRWLAISNSLAEAAQAMNLDGTSGSQLLETAQDTANR